MFQMINFLIVMVVLTKFLYKPIVAFVKKQKEQQEDYNKISLEIAHQKEHLNKLSEDQKAELKRIYNKTMEDTKKEAKEMLDEAKENAKSEGKRIVEEMNSEAKQAKETLLQSAKDDIYNKALNISESLLRSSLTESQKQKLMDMALENLKNE